MYLLLKQTFYTDAVHQEILQSSGNPPEEKVILRHLSLPEGLAYDWIAENLYYTDSDRPEIGVCAVGGPEFYCKILIGREQLDSPRGIAVHPGKQYLFFSQWRKISVIERVDLDGSNSKLVCKLAIVDLKVICISAYRAKYRFPENHLAQLNDH